MKVVSILLILLGYFADCLGEQCTNIELGAPVPARICDPANCIPVTRVILESLGRLYFRAYAWNKGVKPLIGDCAKQFSLNVTNADKPNKLNVVMTVISPTGPSCSNITNGVLPFTAEQDPVTKTISVLDLVYGGSKYQGCIAYINLRFTAAVIRLCRLDPPPPPGMAYACVYAELRNDTRAPPPGLVRYIENNHDIDWAMSVVECTL